MTIASARFADATGARVIVTRDDGTTITIPWNPVAGRSPVAAGDALRAWIADGNAITPYTEPEPTWDDIRAQRDALLRESDWTQLHDSPLDSTAQTVWQAYRQALRDVPETYAAGGPGSVVWPVPPEA